MILPLPALPAMMARMVVLCGVVLALPAVAQDSPRPVLRPGSGAVSAASGGASSPLPADKPSVAAAGAAEAARAVAAASTSAVISSPRPRSRPAGLSRTNTPAVVAAPVAEAAVDAAVAAALQSTRVAPGPLSPRPRLRPARVVAAAAAAANRARAEAEARAREEARQSRSGKPRHTISTPFGDDIDEPEPTAPTPTGATSTAIARRATDDNKIALSKTVLIGIVGGSSTRRAMVRSSSGRITKVKRGDRIGGGTVVQINAANMVLRKGGRDYRIDILGRL